MSEKIGHLSCPSKCWEIGNVLVGLFFKGREVSFKRWNNAQNMLGFTGITWEVFFGGLLMVKKQFAICFRV